MGGGTGTSDDYHSAYKTVIESRIQGIKEEIDYLEKYISSFIISPAKQKIECLKRDITQTIEVYRRYHKKL